MEFTVFDRVAAATSDPLRRIFAASSVRRERDHVLHEAKHLGRAIRESRRFVLDNDLTAVATETSLLPPSYLATALWRARLPFDTVWIEWDKRAQIEVSLARGHASPADERTPKTVGFLLRRRPDRDTTFTIDCIADDPNSATNITIQPYGFVYDTEEPVEPHLLPLDAEISRMIAQIERRHYDSQPGIFAFSGQYLRENRRDPAVARLMQSTRYRYAPCTGRVIRAKLEQAKSERQPELLDGLIREVSGDMRFMLALLGLLNTVSRQAELVRPDGGRLYGTRRIRYMEYHRLSLKLPRRRIIGRLRGLFTESGPRRAHEVMGHWVHRGDGTTYWRRAHMRGDASKGFVQKDYVLTSS